MISRRGFLAGMLAAGIAPAIVTSRGFRPMWQPMTLFRGELGQWNGIVIHETVSSRIDITWAEREMPRLLPMSRIFAVFVDGKRVNILN